MTEIFNRLDEKEKRHGLRDRSTETESLLWQRLRGKQLEGCKFRRQFSVGPYILDFYCPALKLAIEVDGSSHEGEDAKEYDAIRQEYIEGLGIRFLRFSNEQVLADMSAIVQAIIGEIGRYPHEP